jgi:hypothetical protein
MYQSRTSPKSISTCFSEGDNLMKVSHRVTIVLLAVLSTHCGKWAKANKQSVETVAIPTYPKIEDDVFSLNGRKPQTTYRGTMLFINEATSPELLSHVINASVASRESWAEIKRFEQTTNYLREYGDRGLALQALSLMQSDLRNFELTALLKNPITADQRASNARTWITRELEGLSVTGDARATFEANWGAYCEAKIIELATHPVFAKNTYRSKPTPLALCEQYYTDAGFFSGTNCENPSDRNYFSCLWQEGVLKTRWLRMPDPLPSGATTEELEAWSLLSTDMKKKRESLSELLANSGSGLQAMLSLDTSKINSAFIKDTFFMRLVLSQLAPDASDVKRCTAGVKDAALKPFCAVFTLAPVQPSPIEWIDAMEGRAITSRLIQLPLPPSPRRASTQQVIRYVAERRQLGTSESDRLFHTLANDTTLTPPNFGNDAEFAAILGEIRELLAAELYGSLTAADAAVKQEKLENIGYLADKITTFQRRSEQLYASMEKTTNRGFEAANAGNVAHAFLDIRISFQQWGALLQGEFWINGTDDSRFRACYDVTQGAAAECPPQDDGDRKIKSARLFKDPNSGRIDFSFLLEDPEHTGFGPRPRIDTTGGARPDYFMDIGPEITTNRTIKLELYPNRMLGHLDILTGKAFIEDGATRLYEAGISAWEL